MAAIHPPPFETGPVNKVLVEAEQRWDDGMARHHDYHIAGKREYNFTFKLLQYIDEQGNELHSSRVQPRSAYALRLIRYKAADLLSNPLYIDPRPIDPETDQDDMDVARHVLEWEFIYDTDRMFEAHLGDAVWGAFAARRWLVLAQWDPACEPGGEIVYSTKPGWKACWQAGYKSPHEKGCSWFSYEDWMSQEAIERMAEYGWKNTDKVQFGPQSHSPAAIDETDTTQGIGQQGRIPHQKPTEMPGAKVRFYWKRYDKTMKKKVLDDSRRVLEPKDRFMYCPSCDYESMMEGDLGFSLPKEAIGCPNCGPKAVIKRAESLVMEETTRAYGGGKRLVIYVPGMEEPLYDGGWPFENMRSFPVMVVDGYRNPLEDYPISDTALMWTTVCAMNFSMRVGMEQLLETRSRWLFPQTGIYDENGEPYGSNDDATSIMFYKADNKPTIEKIRGGDFNVGVVQFYNMMAGDLRQNEGTPDVSSLSDPKRSKDVAVGTMDRWIEMGNVPLKDHVRTFYQAFAPFANVVLDMVIGGWTQERALSVLGRDGVEKIIRVKGSDLKRFRVYMSSGASADRISKQDMENFQMLINPAIKPYRRSFAIYKGVSPTLMRQIDRDEADFARMQPQQPFQPPAGGQNFQPPPDGGDELDQFIAGALQGPAQ